jgi:hypothetical protein
MKRFILKYQYEIFAIVGVMVVLWQLLLPGYVILLDWPAGPLVNFQIKDVTSLMGLPVNFLLHNLSLVLPGWVIQKILMVGIFFLGFYLPLRVCKVESLPRRMTWGLKSIKSVKFTPSDDLGFIKLGVVPYFISLLNVFNPFVYERFLAGQWRVLVGYLSVLPLLVSLVNFQQEATWKNVRRIFIILFITALFSIHFLAIDSVIILGYILFNLIISLYRWVVAQIRVSGKDNKASNFNWLIKFFGGGMVFLIVSSYWIVPYVLQEGTVLDNFDASHQRAFATARSEDWSVTKNVVLMHGFWGEDHAWVEKFFLPKDTKLFKITFGVLILLVFGGIMFLLKNKKSRQEEIFLLLLLFLSIIFSAGVRSNPWQEINAWLFENVSFWKGFRDSQKWSGVVVVIYVLLAGKGIEFVRSKVYKVYLARDWSAWGGKVVVINVFSLVVLVLPVLLVPQMLFGFRGQVKTTWYPMEWQEVNSYLVNQNDCRVLFLPWHQYYSTRFNDNRLSINLSKNYFDCDVIAGHNTELWGIKPIADEVLDYDKIEKIVTSNNPSLKVIEKSIDSLKSLGIKYIIWTNDLEKSDLYKYPFLQSEKLNKVVNKDNIILYEIRN